MLEIRNTEVFGLDRALVAAGNSYAVGDIDTTRDVTDHDIKRGEKLGNSPTGSGHDNFLSGIIVQFDVKYPQYWTPEFQRYHFAQIVSSESKMHRLLSEASKPLEEFRKNFNAYVDDDQVRRIQEYAAEYNRSVSNDDKPYYQYQWFMKVLSNLPMGYELWMTVSTNYLQLKTIYNQRKNHKLKEDWGEFCEWCLRLPKFRELTGCEYRVFPK